MLTHHNQNLPNDLLPHLEDFKYCRNLQFDFVLMESLLRSRWGPNKSIPADGEPYRLSRLERIEFHTTKAGVPEPHLLSKLHDLAREGMKIAITTADGEWLQG